MKRTVTVIASLMLGIVTAKAQIPNAGFETWANGNPDGWTTTNTQLATVITQSSTAHSGSSAVLGQVQSVGGFPIPPQITTKNFPYTSRPAALTGYYQLTSVSGDEVIVTVGFEKGGNGIGAGSVAVSAAVTSYTQFTVPIFFATADVPDSAVIVVSMGNGGGTDHVGSSFLVDDLSFSGTNAVAESQSTAPREFALNQNYPNPFNPSTIIRYTVGGARDLGLGTSTVRLAVYDVLGREVAVLVNGPEAPGTHEVKFDGKNLSSGVYFYRLTAGNFTAMKTMVLEK